MVRFVSVGGDIRGLWRPDPSNASYGLAVRLGEAMPSSIAGGSKVAGRTIDTGWTVTPLGDKGLPREGQTALIQELSPHRRSHEFALTPWTP